MRSRALVVPFHRYVPFYQDNYRVLFTYWKKLFQIWKDEVDTLYFIDGNNYLHPGEEKAIEAEINPVKLKLFKTENYSHADNLNLVLPQVEEEQILLTDMDTLMYQKGVLNKYFDLLKEVGVLAICERADQYNISRFAPYFFMIQKEALHSVGEIKFDPEPPRHLDPIAAFTQKLLEKTIYMCAPDDRASVYLTKEGNIIRNPASISKDIVGYYHVRNFNGSVHLCDTWITNRENSKHHINVMPDTEISRIMGWLWVLNKKGMQKQKTNETIFEILQYKGFDLSKWNEYIKEFEKLHFYLP